MAENEKQDPADCSVQISGTGQGAAECSQTAQDTTGCSQAVPCTTDGGCTVPQCTITCADVEATSKAVAVETVSKMGPYIVAPAAIPPARDMVCTPRKNVIFDIAVRETKKGSSKDNTIWAYSPVVILDGVTHDFDSLGKWKDTEVPAECGAAYVVAGGAEPYFCKETPADGKGVLIAKKVDGKGYMGLHQGAIVMTSVVGGPSAPHPFTVKYFGVCVTTDPATGEVTGCTPKWGLLRDSRWSSFKYLEPESFGEGETKKTVSHQVDFVFKSAPEEGQSDLLQSSGYDFWDISDTVNKALAGDGSDAVLYVERRLSCVSASDSTVPYTLEACTTDIFARPGDGWSRIAHGVTVNGGGYARDRDGDIDARVLVARLNKTTEETVGKNGEKVKTDTYSVKEQVLKTHVADTATYGEAYIAKVEDEKNLLPGSVTLVTSGGQVDESATYKILALIGRAVDAGGSYPEVVGDMKETLALLTDYDVTWHSLEHVPSMYPAEDSSGGSTEGK